MMNLNTFRLFYSTILFALLSMFWYLMFRIVAPYTSGATDIEPEVAYQMVALPSWVVNLLIAEIVIYYQKGN